MDQVRKDFEEWLVSVGYSTEKLSKSRNGNTYLWATLHADWQTWQAAHAKYAKSDAKTSPPDEWVKQKDLPAKLGNIGLTKVRGVLGLHGAPKPNALGLYSVKNCREFISNLPADWASKK